MCVCVCVPQFDASEHAQIEKNKFKERKKHTHTHLPALVHKTLWMPADGLEMAVDVSLSLSMYSSCDQRTLFDSRAVVMVMVAVAVAMSLVETQKNEN